MSNRIASSQSTFIRTAAFSLIIGLTLVVTASASANTSFGFIDSVKEFLGFEPSLTTVATDGALSNAETSNSLALAAPAAPFVDTVILAWDTQGNAGNEATIASTTTDIRLNTGTLSRRRGFDGKRACEFIQHDKFFGNDLSECSFG